MSKMANTNLVAAQKLDPQITRIISSVSAVATYGFSGNNWAKTEFEGALLVCERNDPKLACCVIILNQQKPQNFIAYIGPDTSLQRKNEYLLYKPPSEEEIKAIWFYNEADCIQTFETLKNAADRMKLRSRQPSQRSSSSVVTESDKTYAEATGSSHAPKSSKDIMSLLSNAQKSFDHQATDKPSGDIPRQSSASDQHLVQQPITDLKIRTAIRDDASSTSSIKQRGGDTGAPFVSLAGGHSDAVDDVNRTKRLHQQSDIVADSSTTTDSSMRGLGGTLSGGSALGKGRGRGISDVNPVVRQLFGSSGASPTSHQPAASAFTHVGQRLKVMGSGDNDAASHAIGAAIAPPPPPMLPSVSPSLSTRPPVLGGADELLTPADLSAFNGSEQGDRVYQNVMPSRLMSVESTGHNIEPTNMTGSAAAPSVRVGQSVLNIEQFKQCYIYLLEHDQFFLESLYDLFMKRSTAGSSASGTTWRG